MNAGKNYLDQGDGARAAAIYANAAAIFPHDPDVHLNLANAHLIAEFPEKAIPEADEVLKLEPNSAAAYFIKGSAYLRLSQPENAVKALENVKKIDPGEAATLFQLGRARMGLSQWDAAILAFQEGLRMDPKRLHASVHYLLGQSLLRAGRQEEARRELEQHGGNVVGGGAAVGPASFERTKFTQARVPFALIQPEKQGVEIRFVEASEEAFAGSAQKFSGPVGLINGNHQGGTGLFVVEKGRGFRVLDNKNGVLRARGELYPNIPGATYSKVLVGDLQNDRFEDVVVLGSAGTHLFTFAAKGHVSDLSAKSGLHSLTASDGLLIDLDFTGKLDLIAIRSSNELSLLRQSGPLLFHDITGKSGIPATLQNARSVAMEDWNRDGSMDIIAGCGEGAPLLLEKERGGQLIPRNPQNWSAGPVFATGDFNNDLRPDLAVLNGGHVTICFDGAPATKIADTGNGPIRQLLAVDHDNDGWLDLWLVGDNTRAWRNVGLAGFTEQTAQMGLEKISGGAAEIHFADFDGDCDLDFVVAGIEGGLRYLRNDTQGGNALVKVRMIGNRSNASGIGCKIEIATGGLRLTRTVRQLPVEVGVGKSRKLDSFLVHWFNWPQGSADLEFDCKEPLFALESTIQEGSCPYLYAWDGSRFCFLTDILGAAPLGLPLAESRYIEGDPEEIVWIGSEQTFAPRNGSYELRITEELREVLYLDDAKLVVVDHEPGTEVQSTDKLLPGGPFPQGKILTLHRARALLKAETLEGEDVTSLLIATDRRRVSPRKLRVPQLRGLAETHGVVLDFGILETRKPLVLVMNGWLRFGGGMANIAASHDPALPFPFPMLEAEDAAGEWKAVDVVVGAPAGKTKTIVVELDGKLNPGTRRLRITHAFEIHWDRIALLERRDHAATDVASIPPTESELRFRGFSSINALPSDEPLTPDYDVVSPNYFWTITPGGWCTRYGDVSELIATRDEGLALINSGDELMLRFAESSLPPKRSGAVRDFFLFVDGWDKDSDFHVAKGTELLPLPFHGMNYQNYGSEERPAFASDALHRKYNTRWVDGKVLKQMVARD